MKPSVLFINRVYPPDEGASGLFLRELADGLVERGWNVTVVASGKQRQTGPHTSRPSDSPGPRVLRVGGLPYDARNSGRRAASYLSLYPAMLGRAVRLSKPGLIVTMTDPPLQLSLGPWLASAKRSRLVHWAQDIYPEIAEELGVLRPSGWIADGLRRISNWALGRQAAIVAVGHCMKERLVSRGLAPGKIRVVPNWALSSTFASSASGKFTPADFRRKHQLEDRFVVMYSGNLGLAHPIEVMLEAARILQTSEPKIVFGFVGQGGQAAALQSQARSLRNIRLLPVQPLDTLHSSLAAADLHLAGMHARLLGLVVPSKVYGIVAAGRSCLFLGPENSEAARLILRTGTGQVLSPTDPKELADWVRRLATNRPQIELWENQARLAGPTLTRDSAVAEFHSILEGLR